jgi:hypothetical protein
MQVDELRVAAEQQDAVLLGCNRADKDEVLLEALRGIARESAALRFERERVARQGGDPSQLCSRRVDGLVRIASIICERARAGGAGELDVRSPKFAKVVSCFEQILGDAAQETMGEEMAELFVRRYRMRLEGWQDRIDPPRVPEMESSPAR